MKKEVKEKSLLILEGVEIVFLSFAIVFLVEMLIHCFVWEGNDFSFSEWWRWLKNKRYIIDKKTYDFESMYNCERVFFNLKYFIYSGAILILGIEGIRSFGLKKVKKIIIIPILIVIGCSVVHWKLALTTPDVYEKNIGGCINGECWEYFEEPECPVFKDVTE